MDHSAEELRYRMSLLQELLDHPGWKLLVDDMQVEIDTLEESIFAVEEKAEKLYTEKEIFRHRRNDMVRLRERPAQVIRDIHSGLVQVNAVEERYFSE